MRVVIAEDSALLRAGIERILTDAGHDVVAGVPDATNLLRLVNDTRPDLAIVDVRMPPTFTDEGIRAAALLRSQNPESPVLVLSHYVEERYAADLIASDTKGFGYLLKDRVADVPAFLDAVESSAAGARCSIQNDAERGQPPRRRGSVRRVEVHSVDGDVITPSAISVTESFGATTVDGDIEVDFKDAAPRTLDTTTRDGDIRIGLPPRGPHVVNANTDQESGATVVRVPQTTSRTDAAAVITARSENGDVVVDDLR